MILDDVKPPLVSKEGATEQAEAENTPALAANLAQIRNVFLVRS